MRDQALRIASEAPLQDSDGALAVGMEKTEVAGPAQAFGQDMSGVVAGRGTKRSLLPLPARMCTRRRAAS
ncbi:hypothetical protein, partial [Thiocapsa sp.]|uniref:hypothetical protein n=1 Tax=Thiocapsa sp. TaxID=2024551 RepID=UPI0035941DAC